MKRLYILILIGLIVQLTVCAQSGAGSLNEKFSQVQYHPECGGWYFLSQQKNGETLYGLADKNGNVIVSEARKFKLHKGYIEFYLLDSQKKAAHDQWKVDMRQYEMDNANYERVNAQYEAEKQAYNARLEAAETEATNRWNAERARVEKIARANAEAEQRKRAQQSAGAGWLGIIGAALGGVSDGVAIANAVNAVKFDPIFELVKAERGLVVGPSKPYNPKPTKPKEPSSGYYWESFSLRQPCNYTFVDYSKISEGDGFADVKSPSGQWGLVDATMQEIIPCNNQNKVFVGWQNEDLCKIKTDSGYGIINKENKVVIPSIYTLLTKFGNKGFIATKQGVNGIIDADGKERLPFVFQKILDQDGLLFCKKDNNWGIYTQSYEEIFPCQFQNVKLVNLAGNKYLLTQLKGLWGALNFETGQPVLANQFNSVEEMSISESNGCFKVKRGDYTGLYSTKGAVILPCKFDAVQRDKDWLVVNKGVCKGLYSTEGVEYISPDKYISFKDLEINMPDGRKTYVWIVRSNGLEGICSIFGTEIIPCKYDYLTWNSSLGGFVAKKENKYGVISLAGDEVVPFVFNNVPAYSSTSPDYLTWGDHLGAADFSGNIIATYKKINAKNKIKTAKTFEKLTKKKGSTVLAATAEKKELLKKAQDKVVLLNRSELQKRSTFSFYAQNYVERIINDWQQRGEFEKIEDWKIRVNESSRSQKIYQLTSEAQKEFIALKTANLPKDNLSIIGSYDPDNETYRVKSDYSKEDLLVHVPSVDAQEFKTNFSTLKNQPYFFVENEGISLSEYHFTMPSGKKYKYSNQNSLTYNLASVEYNFNPVEIDGSTLNNNFKRGTQTISTTALNFGTSDIDVGIPQSTSSAPKTFAIIIANENYQQETPVEFAFNDGQIFQQYCTKTLGIPEKNVHFRANATLNDMRFEFNWMKQMASAYEGEAKFIVYYAGHGMPDPKTKNAYLLPVDGYSSDVTSGYKLSDFYDVLGDLPSENVIAFLDACFSGAQRDGSVIAKGERGVAITPDIKTPKGNLVVFSAASGNETAHSYKEKHHGLFTYYLLKKIKEHSGALEFEELANYVKKEVKTTALKDKSLSQTPTVNPASSLGTRWKNILIK